MIALPIMTKPGLGKTKFGIPEMIAAIAITRNAKAATAARSVKNQNRNFILRNFTMYYAAFG